MEIRHTIEILTKDIQDIEKLVGNFQNSPEGSLLELDLALSKIRHVYDMLTMIRTDMLLVRNPPERESIRKEIKEKREPGPESESVIEGKMEIVAEIPAEAKEEAVPEAPEEVKMEPIPEQVTERKKGTGILAERFSSESSINENMAGQRAADLDSAIMGKPIDNIGRNIGINDRFLIIRELFNGDGDRFSRLVGNLDSAGNYQEAVRVIGESFSNTPDHEGVTILMSLVKRRYIRQ